MTPRHFAILLLSLCAMGCSVERKMDQVEDFGTPVMAQDVGGELADAEFTAPDMARTSDASRVGVTDASHVGITDAGVQTDGAVDTTDAVVEPPARKSFKRGIAYGFGRERDLAALSRGIAWWYNWSPSYGDAVADAYRQLEIDWVPMTWNGNNPDQIRSFLAQHPEVRYLLTYNEPNFQDQANMTPAYAASIWPEFEAIAEEYDVELVGPAMNFCGGCVVVDGAPIANDYVVWLDAFFESYETQFGRQPRMDYTALHWYDFGLQEQVERMVERYGKPVWVTEFALWRSEDWNTPEFERDWLLEVVAFLEAHPMVYRYSWFTGRRPDFPRINLLAEDGVLTPLGEAYLNAPF